MQRWILVSLCSVFVACSGGRGDSLDNTSLPAVGEDAGAITGETNSGEPDASEADEDAGSDAGDEPSDGGDGDAQGPEILLCGNGELDPGEQCDDGDANSDTEPGACRLRCVLAGCGDGILDTGEECDNGQTNSDYEPDACRLTCLAPRCGDNVRDNGEECDTGAARSDSEPSACRLRCVSASCGDNVRDNSEGCDDGNSNDNDACRNSCRSASCGDGARTPDEECDDGNNDDGDTCQANCRNPRCGDGVRDTGERCDDGNTANNDGCRNDCQPGCTSGSACDDSTYCNGAEQCVEGLCQDGSAPSADDGVACTVDTCDEANDNASHVPNPSLCNAPPRMCAGGVVTEQNVSCVATSGCAISPWTRACADQASTCNQIANGFRLLTYAPACNAASSDCGLPALTSMRDCTSPGARCEGRVGIVSRATCNPAAETCGVEEVSRDNCALLDRPGVCAARNVSWSRTTGVCGAGACAANMENQTCTVSPTTCSAGSRTTYTRACSAASGCLPSTATTAACPVNPAVACTNFGAGTVASHYEPSCQDGSTCSTDGTLSQEACVQKCAVTAAGIPALSIPTGCNQATGRCNTPTLRQCSTPVCSGGQICGGCSDLGNGPACLANTACRPCPNGQCAMVNGVATCQ